MHFTVDGPAGFFLLLLHMGPIGARWGPVESGRAGEVRWGLVAPAAQDKPWNAWGIFATYGTRTCSPIVCTSLRTSFILDPLVIVCVLLFSQASDSFKTEKHD